MNHNELDHYIDTQSTILRGEELCHFGIKGMKWGVRRFQNKDGSYTAAGRKRYYASVKTSKGETIQITEKKDGKIASFLAKRFPEVAKNQRNQMSATITNSHGDKVGNLFLENEGRGSLNVNWIDIGKEHRGRGYASAVMRNVVSYAKQKGYKQITLEVPGSSPDAKHIYEKLGFKDVGSVSNKDDIWDGLTAMKLTIKDDELKHFGIKGMKWGVRRYQNKDGSLTAAGEKRYYGKAKAIQKDIDSFKPYRKTGLRSKSGKVRVSKKEVNDIIKALKDVQAKAYAKGEAKRKKDYKKLTKTQNKGGAKKFLDTRPWKDRSLGEKAFITLAAANLGTGVVNKFRTGEFKDLIDYAQEAYKKRKR